MIAPSLEEIAAFLPQWLSNEQKGSLFRELEKVPVGFKFYDGTEQFRDEFLQGDGWSGFVAIDFETLQRQQVSGVIISNSCDIDPNNREDHERNILFAPLLSLARFRNCLIEGGIAVQTVDQKMDLIRQQRITDIFYLPQQPGTQEELIILLDDIHRHPLANFLARDRAKLFTLTQTAFYVFLIKISIHFHRVKEGVVRWLPKDEQ